MYDEGLQLFDESQSLYNRIKKKTHRYLYEGYGVNHLALVDAALRCCADGKP
jgi:tryptophan synthase alpha subunit